jgi:DNA-directed RNA polymerase specialized sigma subunit, sigma24 homolog
LRKRIRYFDMERIERDSEPLTSAEREVKKRLFYDPRGATYAYLDLDEALKTLSGKQAECFKLVIQEGYTERAAAQILGISNDSVHVHIKRAREKLRKFFWGVKQSA